MAGKNEDKIYIENAYYHIYNRGVEKRKIFQEEQDYATFLSYLKTYLIPKGEKSLSEKLGNSQLSYRERDKILKALRLNNFAGEITLLAYCLMPNHFHLLIKQKSRNAIDMFMNSIGTRYTMYFNRKYYRVGPLYQGTYKAVLIETDAQLLHLTRYIHQNPLKINQHDSSQSSQGDPLRALLNQPSSYFNYLGKRKTEWLDPTEILAYFSKSNPNLSYKDFMGVEESIEIITGFTLDENQPRKGSP